MTLPDGPIPSTRRTPQSGSVDATAPVSGDRSEPASASEVAPLPSRSPPIVPGYEVHEELGRGGMGVVFRATQAATKRPVALKLLLRGPYASDREQLRFEREIELAARLRHAHIVQVFASGTTPDGLVYYVMEYVDGVSLDRYALRGPARPLAQVLRLMARVATAVHFAHQRGVLHRDLKPGNLHVDPQGEPHVLDFGLARGTDGEAAGPTLTETGEFLGTPAYASPEQARGDVHQIDVRSDVYALGVILYQLLGGRFPYDISGPMVQVLHRIVHDEPEPLRRGTRPARYAIDEVLEAIILKALAKDQAQRYQSAEALADDLTRYLAGEATQARPLGRGHLVRVWFRKNLQATVGILLLGVVRGMLLAMPRVVDRRNEPWQSLALAYATFPEDDLPRVPLVEFYLSVPDWVLRARQRAWWPGLAMLGLLSVLIARPRDREGDVAAGFAAGAVTALVALTLGGMSRAIILTEQIEATRPDLDLLGAAGAGPGDRCAERYPELQGLSAAEQGERMRARLVAVNARATNRAIGGAIFLGLGYYIGTSLTGALAAGYMLRQRGRALPMLVPYMEVVLPAMLLVRGILVNFPCLLTVAVLPMLAVLTAVALCGTAARWSWPKRYAAYAVGWGAYWCLP